MLQWTQCTHRNYWRIDGWPFDYVKSINKKNYEYDLAGYNPFLTNRAFAGFIDTIMFAEAMNQAHLLSPALQYDFYYYFIP